jgi:Tol biopolymer transport system component
VGLGLMPVPSAGEDQDRYPVRQLSSEMHQEGFPSWSPDGTKIAFTSARSGKMDVYVMDLDVADVRARLKALNE